MADVTVRTLIPQAEYDSLVTQFKALRDDFFNSNPTGVIHRDDNVADVSAPNAVDLATSLVLTNQIKSLYNSHVAKTDAHKAADATNPTAVVDATDLTSVQTLLNDLKTKFNAHIILLTSHATTGSADNVATANATDQTTSNALANALKTAFNLHHKRTMTSLKIVRGPA